MTGNGKVTVVQINTTINSRSLRVSHNIANNTLYTIHNHLKHFLSRRHLCGTRNCFPSRLGVCLSPQDNFL